MNNKKWHIVGFCFILIFGILFHYIYEWSEYNKLAGYFGAVNESVWEHLKLIFWPCFIFSVIEFFAYGKRENDFFLVKLVSVCSAMSFVVIFFYTYSGILGFNIGFIDIFSFVPAIFIGQIISYKLMSMNGGMDRADNFRAFVMMLFIALCFIMWTYNPPQLGIFWG